MPVFVRVEGEHATFWEVELEDCTVTIRSGVFGGRGEQEVRELADEENAALLVERLVAARRAEGFVPLEEAELPGETPREGPDEHEDDAFRDNGWQRFERTERGRTRFWAVQIIDGELLRTRSGAAGSRGREKDLACRDYWDAHRQRTQAIQRRLEEGYLPADRGVRMARNPELEAEILAAPDDSERWLVYGDWLQSAGDPRGELIALDHAIASGNAPANAPAARQELLARHADFLLPPALQDQMERLPVNASWRLGFLDALRLAGTDDGAGSFEASVLEILRHPSARFLRELVIGSTEDHDYGGVVRQIAAAPPPLLRGLHLADFTCDDCELSWSALGDVSPLYPALPRLEWLILRGGSMELGHIRLPALRRFEVQTGGLSAASVWAIAAADWPELRELRVWFGQAGYGAGGDLAGIEPILAGVNLPHLENLGLMNAEFADAICQALPDAPVLRQLKVLDLSMGTMTDADAARLAARADGLRHLERIVVDRCYLTAEGRRRLETIGPEIAFGEQRDLPYDDEDRYAAVGE